MNDFALDISKFVTKAKENITNVVRKVSLEVFSRVIMETPADTGRARANWQTTIGAPANGEITDVTEKSKEENTARAINETTKLVDNYDVGGQSLFITNNVPYIGVLENNNGMVEVTLTEYPGIVQKAAEEANR